MTPRAVTADEWGSTRHATTSGYDRHYTLGEKPCAACRKAKADYDKRQRSSTEGTRRNRLRAKAQQTAYRILRNRYPDEYGVLYRQSKQELGL